VGILAQPWNLLLAACVGGVALAVALVVLPPLFVRAGQTLRLRQRCRGRLVLSYDDGPAPSATGKLLDLLDRYGVKASFYLVGFRAESAPELCDRLVASGHDLGTHTYGHVNVWKCSPWRAVKELHAGCDRLARWVKPDGYFRPPFGKLTTWTWLAARRRGVPLSWWTIDSGDSRLQPPDPQLTAQRVVEARGGVVLMHCHDRGRAYEDHMLDLTERLLDAARRHHLDVCTYAELFSSGEERQGGVINDRTD
jgi:peptidoglycan/xylan/chitin deacetylase (PgdA/CDA1 family)